MWGGTDFLTNNAEVIGYTELNLKAYTKFNSKYIMNLSVKCKIINLLGENVAENVRNLSRWSFRYATKAQFIKGKKDIFTS